MFDPSAVFYMDKIAAGPEAADVIDIDRAGRREHPAGREGQARPSGGRHGLHPRPASARELVDEVREAGARIRFISDGDVAGAISAARPGTGVDLLLGIGGTPEGIIAAAALRCMGGAMQAKLWPRDDAERQKAIDAGHDLDRVLLTEDLVRGDDIFFCATGITDGELLRGVRYHADSVQTQSIVMRSKSGTIRLVDSCTSSASSGLLGGGLRPAFLSAGGRSRSHPRTCRRSLGSGEVHPRSHWSLP